MGGLFKNGGMAGGGLEDESSKAGLLSDGSGIALPVSCKHCSSEAQVDLSWQEIHGMAQGQIPPPIPGMWTEKTVTGFLLGRVCEKCAKHYAAAGQAIHPKQGMAIQEKKAALARRREVSAIRPIGYEMLLKWVAIGKSRGLF